MDGNNYHLYIYCVNLLYHQEEKSWVQVTNSRGSPIGWGAQEYKIKGKMISKTVVTEKKI